MKRTELLAPAGSFEALRAAVQAGADAVYLAGTRFGARQSAENFDAETLKEAIDYCHIRGVKVYGAVNTLIKTGEMEAALESVALLRRLQIDAVILQDWGLTTLVHRHWPELELHGSTQMSLYDAEGVRHAMSAGLSRIVIARETSAEEIRAIARETGAEIEAFVHGALCYSYSGQCLMSSQIGGRSGNRGCCAQPCRKRYSLNRGSENGPLVKEGYVLSTRDLMTLPQLEQLVASGIASLKIEGRLRRSDYVAAVVAAYRQALDRCYGHETSLPEGVPAIGQVFNRESTAGRILKALPQEALSTKGPGNMGQLIGITERYDSGRKQLHIKLSAPLRTGDGIKVIAPGEPGAQVNGIFADREKLQRAEGGRSVAIPFKTRVPAGAEVRKTLDLELGKQAQAFAQGNLRRVPLEGRITLAVGQLPSLRVTDPEGRSVEAVGETPLEPAQTPRQDDSRLRDQLQKTGDSAYVFKALTITAEPEAHVPVKTINGLRREALLKLDALRAHPYDRPETSAPGPALPAGGPSGKKTGLAVTVNTLEQLKALRGLKIDRIDYTDLETLGEAIALGASLNLRLCAALPALGGLLSVADQRKHLAAAGWNGPLRIGNPGQLGLLQPGQEGVGDYTLNGFNPWTAAHFAEAGLSSLCLSPELSRDELLETAQHCRAELLAYGRLVVMTSPLCPVQCGGPCDSRGGQRFSLTDEKGYVFPARCRDGLFEVMNSRILNLIDAVPGLPEGAFSALRLDFDQEPPAVVRSITEGFMETAAGRARPKETAAAFSAELHTAGSFRNGIE